VATASVIETGQGVLCVDGGIDSGVTGGLLAGARVDWKYDEHGITDKAQYFAAPCSHCGGDELEIVVEHFQHLFWRQGFGQVSKIAQVTEPERRTDNIGIAAANHSVQHFFAGSFTHVGIHQRFGQMPERLDFYDGSKILA